MHIDHGECAINASDASQLCDQHGTLDKSKDRKAHDGPRSVFSSHEEPLLPGIRKSNQALLRAADEVFELYGSL